MKNIVRYNIFQECKKKIENSETKTRYTTKQ